MGREGDLSHSWMNSEDLSSVEMVEMKKWYRETAVCRTRV